MVGERMRGGLSFPHPGGVPRPAVYPFSGRRL